MPIIEFYKYSIDKKIEQPNLLEMMGETDENPPYHYDSPQDCFGSFFKTGGKISFGILVTDAEGDSEWELFGNDILRHEEGVILMTLENNKEKHTIVNKQDTSHEHHPYCNIIFDNRLGHQYIAIERNSAFDNKTDKVANLMMSAFNNHNFLGQYHLEFTMEKMKKKKVLFWSMITDIRTLFHDEIRQIRLDFNGNTEEMPDPDGLTDILQQLAKKAECATALLLCAESDLRGIKLEEIHEDLTHLAEICMTRHGYNLSVRFKRFGIFRYGADVLAQFGIEDELLSEFEKRSPKEINNIFDDPDINVTLISWLDRMHTILKDYEHEPLVSTKRKICRRRKVR